MLIVSLLLFGAPLALHVETSPSGEAEALHAAALSSLVRQLEALGDEPRMGEPRGACDEACLRRLTALTSGGDVLVVSIIPGLRKVRIELQLYTDALRALGVVEGVPGSELWNDALRGVLLGRPRADTAAPTAPAIASAPPPERFPAAWVLGGSGLALGVGLAFATIFAIDGATLNQSPNFDDAAASADARRQVTGPLAIGFAAAAVAGAVIAFVGMQAD